MIGRIGIFLWLSAASHAVSAYVLTGHRWPMPETTFVFDIVNTRGETRSPGGIFWNDAFEEALGRWTEHTGFTFLGQPGIAADPCSDDNRNTVGFRLDDCGFVFGDTTLAVTYSLFSRDILSETDIVFNDNEAWDTYDGPLRTRVTDFTRVATHELGHALGLGHENRVPSIMSPLVGTLTLPQKDDIDGVDAIYGGQTSPPAACQAFTPLSLNQWIEGRLEAADCRRLHIASSDFSSDDSAVDLYSLELPVDGLIVVRMQSLQPAQLDPYLEIRDSGGDTVLNWDDDSGVGTDALIYLRLSAGSYQIVANSAYLSLQEGDYRLQVGINLESPAPARVEADGSATVDSVDVSGGLPYQARLIPYTHPDDPQGSYWRLERVATGEGEPLPGAILLPDSNDLIVNPIEVFGSRYDAILRLSPTPQIPWLWKLESATQRN
ncbi:MAG: matrixin family metalloprotease [Methylohalobius sp. ZOD2]